VLDFSRTIYEDLSNYDANGAWPTLIDEYVSSRRSQATSPAHRDCALSAFGDCAEAAPLPLSIPARPGSKRQLPQDDEEANALASRLESLRPSCHEDAALTAGRQGNGCPPRDLHKAKRSRVHGGMAADRIDSHAVMSGSLNLMPLSVHPLVLPRMSA